MVTIQKLSLTVRRGSAESIPVRIETGRWRYAPVAAVLLAAPLRIVAPAHGVPNNWRVAMQNIKAVGAFAATGNPPTDRDLLIATRIDEDTIEFNEINGAAFRPHTGGGQIAYRAPLDLTLYVGARMNVRDRVGGALVADYTTDNGRLELDPINDALWLRLTEADTAALTAKPKVFDIELIRGGGDPDRICTADSALVVLEETTTE